MTGKRTLPDLVRDAGVTPVLVRQPLPAPSQPAIIASENDRMLARELLVEQRRNNPEYRDPHKQLKRIFRSSKEKEKLQDTSKWEFTQDELDRALSAIIDQPNSSTGLVQAFIHQGAKVNFIDTFDDKKNKGTKHSNVSARRRSTVLQRAANLRRADSVGLLASSGADQTTLDEALKAAIATNDQACIQELLRHGADINKFPNTLADAVRSNDQNLIRLLLRAPKPLRIEIISSCLPAAVQMKSEQAISLLVGYGADPNFNDASALRMAISHREYRLAVALVAGPIRLTPGTLHGALETIIKLPSAQEIFQYLQLLLCCGLPPQNPSLAGLLATACKRDDTPVSLLLVDHGVSTSANEAECLRSALSNSNWRLADAILQTSISPTHAAFALAVLPAEAPHPERLRIIGQLLRKGASGPPLERWLIRAVEEGDTKLMEFLLQAGAPLESSNGAALKLAILRKDQKSLRMLLRTTSSPETLSQAFPMLREGYSPSERLETVRILLENGARGNEVDRTLVDAVADTSPSRDVTLITELVLHGANINHDDGKVVRLAAGQADMALLQLFCKSNLSIHSTSAALPLAFGMNGNRHSTTLQIIELLLANGIEEKPALETLRIAIKGGQRNLDVVNRLLRADANLIAPAFKCAIELNDINVKTPILTHLLTMGIQQPALDEALATEVKSVQTHHDLSVLALLLDYGGSVNYNNGEPLSTVVASGSYPIVQLLLDGKENPSRSTVTRSFRTLFVESTGDPQAGQQSDRFAIATDLLQRGVDQPAIDSALRMVLDDEYPGNDYEALVDLLIQKHANVNIADGTCFVFAARKGNFDVLEKLLTHNPDFNTIIPTLISSKLGEDILVKTLETCFTHGLRSIHLEKGGNTHLTKASLILTMREYPRSDQLVKLLLAHGCNPDITAPTIVDPNVGEESVSALMWALAQSQKAVSTAVIQALLNAKASPTRSALISETSPIALASREGRHDIVQELINCGADASVRDKWNRSALFYVSSSSSTSIVQTLAAYALKDDGSLHEAARSLQLENAIVLVKEGHKPNFPCRLHNGRNALGELCVNAELTGSTQRTRARQLIRLFLDNGAKPEFKARNERSAVILALDNAHSSLDVTEALLETEVWEDLNDEKHMFRDEKGLWYSPIKYAELVPSPSRALHKKELIELLCDKGCKPKYYSENPEQPEGAIGMPAPIAELFDRQKAHQLSLKLVKEANEHTRMLEESNHRDILRRKQEKQDAEMAAAAATQAQWQALEQSKHEFEIQRVRSAERMKRTEKVAWHNLQVEQERDFATQRLQIEERKASATHAEEARLIQQRQAELEHRTRLEKKSLLEKEKLFERNVNRQKQLTDRLDESAQLHARLRQDRPAIEPAKWGSVD